MSDRTEESRALMFPVTEEIWNEGRVDLIDELIAENFVEPPRARGLGREGAGTLPGVGCDDARRVPGLS